MAASPRLALGLVLGLGLAVGACGDGDGKGDTVADDWQDADAVTYGGPDSWGESDSNNDAVGNDSQEASTGSTGSTGTGSTSIESTGTESSGSTGSTGSTGEPTVGDDGQEADAVTYGGPDENTSTTGG